MKQAKNISITALLCLLFVFTAFAQDAKNAKKVYKNIEVEQFTATEDSKFPAEDLAELTKSVYDNFLKTKRFESVKLNGGTVENKMTLGSSSNMKNDESMSMNSEETDNSADADEKDETNSDTNSGKMMSDANGSVLKISGEITKYNKGNRAKRYLIGFGAGATKIVANITFTSAETGEVVLKTSVDGDVWIGVFGGDSDGAKSGVADEIMKVLKKNNLVGDKMKK